MTLCEARDLLAAIVEGRPEAVALAVLVGHLQIAEAHLNDVVTSFRAWQRLVPGKILHWPREVDGAWHALTGAVLRGVNLLNLEEIGPPSGD